MEVKEVNSSSDPDPGDAKEESSGLKSQLLMDFGLENEVSEEDVSDNNVSGGEDEKVEVKLKSKLLADFGLGNEGSEEEDSEENEKVDEKEVEKSTDDNADVFKEEESIVNETSDDQNGEKSAVNETEVSVSINKDVENDKPEEDMEIENDNEEVDNHDGNDKSESKEESEEMEIEEKNIEEEEFIDNEGEEQVKPTKPITKKVSPLKIGQLKNSPKKVHFSPEVVFRDQNREEFVSTPKSTNSKKIVQPAASTDSSPPLKLKIKFGKDKSGAITHCKINPKPESKDEQFHGFEDSEIPAWVTDNFEGHDLKTGFGIKPTVFVSISSKKTQKQVEENMEIPTVSEQATTASAPIPKLILSVGGQKEGGGGGMSKRERRRKSDNFNFVKPLYDGWYREVVWRPVPGSDGTKKDAEVFYYPPNPPGQKTLRYR